MVLITRLLHYSYIDNEQMNNGRAYDKFSRALFYLKRVSENDRNQAVITFFKQLFMNNDNIFIKRTLTETINSFTDYDKLLMPYSKALKYLEENDDDFLENLHPEERAVIKDILGMDYE